MAEEKKFRNQDVEAMNNADVDGCDISSISNFCLQMAALSHERAKELAEKERDASKSKNPVRFSLMNMLSQLALLDKQYFSLSFLSGQKSIFRKENVLKVSYNNLQSDLSRLVQDNKSPARAQHSMWLPRRSSVTEEDEVDFPHKMLGDIRIVILARMDMMELYEKMSSWGAGAAEATATGVKQLEDPNAPDGGLKAMVGSMMMPYDKILKLMERWKMLYHDKLSGSLLDHLGESFLWEFQVLEGLVKALHLLGFWRLFETLIELQVVSDGLRQWAECQQKRQEASSHKSIFESFWSGRSGQQVAATSPALFQWLKDMKDLVLGKYSLYFFQTMSTQTSLPMEMRKRFDSKVAVNFIKQIEDFQRECEAPMVTLIYNATEDLDYNGPGFHLPGTILPPVMGNDLFPAVFTSVLTSEEEGELEFQTALPPATKSYHWFAILKGMKDEMWKLALPQMVVHFYDQQIQYTYFLTRVDPDMTLVVIFDTKRRDLDPKVKSFMLGFTSQLRGCKSFAGLRPGYRMC